MFARLLETVKGLSGSVTERDDGSFHVNLDNTPVEDLTPLKGFPISGLSLRNTRVKDIGPISEMPLRELTLVGSKELADILPLSGLRLEKLWLEQSSVTNLAPLRGMPLRELYLNDTPVSDLSPLADLRLERLNAPGIKATDLTPLQRMPLKRLHLDRNPQITDVSVLAEIKTLENVLLPSAIPDASLLRTLPNLKTIDIQYRGPDVATTAVAFFATYDPRKLAGDRKAVESKRAELEAKLRAAGFAVQPKLRDDGTIELNLDDQKIADLQLLSGFPISRLSLRKAPIADLTALRGMPLTFLSIRDTKVSDLSPLAELPLEELVADAIPAIDFTPITGLRLRRLSIGGTKVQDLAQFTGMPLVDLTIWNCPNIRDIAPLRTLALTNLNMSSVSVTDLSPLRRLPLRHVRLHGTISLDVSALAECQQLESLTLPAGATGIEALRRLPKLRELAITKTEPPRMPLAVDFWRGFDVYPKPAK